MARVVYFAQARDGTIKIGTSINVDDRLRSLGRLRLLRTVPGGFTAERVLHHALEAHRARGREWYHPTAEVLACVADPSPFLAPRTPLDAWLLERPEVRLSDLWQRAGGYRLCGYWLITAGSCSRVPPTRRSALAIERMTAGGVPVSAWPALREKAVFQCRQRRAEAA